MRTHLFRLAAVWLLALSLLCVPALGVGETADTASEGSTMQYVIDIADLLSYDAWKTLEDSASELSAQYGCGVYIVTLEDYSEYGSSIETVIEDAYDQLELGEGDGRDGIVLMLSMSERDFATFTYGERAEYAFNSYGLKQLEESFLDNFADDDWYGGFSDYLTTCGDYLALADSGQPVRADPRGAMVLMVILALVISLVICLVLKTKMKSVHKKAEANAYVTAAGLKLAQHQDLYTHTTETRTKIESKSAGSSSSFSGSSGGSGRSGKF